jgi:hypothetical protein
MSRSRGSLLTAWFALCLTWGLAGLAAVTQAQIYEAARQVLDLSPDPIARAPRLLGMGVLTLVSTQNNRINLWDFAANPTGVIDADSLTTFELRPGSAAAAGFHDGPAGTLERQGIASRETRLGYEGWHRSKDGATYGLYGTLSTLRNDELYGQAVELRHTFQAPNVTAVLNGHVPKFKSEQFRYAFEVFYGTENQNDEYLTLFHNAMGDYLGKKGDLLDPPDFFTPDQYRVSTVGGGFGLNYIFGPTLTTSLVFHGSGNHIVGENSSVIHDMGTGEDRPYYTLQGTATGRGLLLPGTKNAPFEWIYDGSKWSSSGEGRWVFTLKAGINQDPYAGRGKLFDRNENGWQQRLRGRLWKGAFELNGSAAFWSDDAEIHPPDPNDASSFNAFIGQTYRRDGADTLALPDSIRFNHYSETGMSAAVGGTWKLRKGLLGMEYHVAQRKLDQTITGPGPDQYVWDLRTGLEYPCTPVFAGRLGYVYRSDDRDTQSQRNEITSNTLTIGFGLARPGAVWSVDFGYAYEWLSPNFEDANGLNENRHTLAAQIRWAL